MSRSKLRWLERRWQETGAEEDAERLLAARVRQEDVIWKVMRRLIRLERVQARARSNESDYLAPITAGEFLAWLDAPEPLGLDACPPGYLEIPGGRAPGQGNGGSVLMEGGRPGPGFGGGVSGPVVPIANTVRLRETDGLSALGVMHVVHEIRLPPNVEVRPLPEDAGVVELRVREA